MEWRAFLNTRIFSAGDNDGSFSLCSVEVPSAENIEDVNSPWPRVHSLEESHRINEGTSVIAKEFLRQLGMQPKFALSVQRLGLDTMTSVPREVLDEISLNADGDEILDAILPYLHEVLEQAPLDPTDPLSQAIYHGTLESIVGAFLWPKKHGNSYMHAIPSLVGVTYKLQILLWRRAENQRLSAVAEEFAERREEHASVDEGAGTAASV